MRFMKNQGGGGGANKFLKCTYFRYCTYLKKQTESQVLTSFLSDYFIEIYI